MALHPQPDTLTRSLRTLLALLAVLLLLRPAHAQPPTGRIYSRQPGFRIPFETDAGERRLQEVQLYVSEDRGQTWQKYGSVQPEQRGFYFRADHDGLYWFTVRTVDFQGRGNPVNVQGARPQLEVFVDTQAPIVSLRQASAREGSYAVEWEIREENLDLSNFFLEYRPPGGSEWVPLTVEPATTGQRAWNAVTSGPVDVRLRVRDLAKNEGEQTIRVAPSAQSARPSGSFGEPDAAASTARAVPTKRFVNSKQISINYEIKVKGPSGVQAVELWVTRDGRTWAKDSEDDKSTPPYKFEVPGEGLYGLTLVIRSGVGLSEPPPRNGDPPQMWVEVDLTPPVVHYVKADVGRGSASGTLTITWQATDKNLGREPISLAYAEKLEGPWTPIVTGYENSGTYHWTMPPNVPFRFFVRAQATDQAGNVGTYDWSKPVIVDLVQPKGLILGVDPTGK